MRGKPFDLTGKRFGKLIALNSFRRENDKHYFWNCKCDCGKNVAVSSSRLIGGNTKSCGCLSVEFNRTRKPGKKHGLYLTKLYAIWVSMRQRCSNPKSQEYSSYGGRGITISPEWDDFKKFYDWAMSHGYKEGLSIDRIDNDGNYSTENCQWLTRSENASKGNRRTFC
jgi:hypothetical protein